MTTITKSLIVSPVTDGTEIYPRIGYANLFRSGTVTASSEAESGPKEQAYDGFTYDFWTTTGSAEESIQVQNASASPADYMAVAAHTLTGCDVTPQYSSDGAAWTNLADAFEVQDNSPIVWEFTQVSAVYFRLLIQNATGAVSIGAIHVGVMLTMQRGMNTGWQPPSLNEDIRFTNSISEGGQILGRNIVSYGASVQVQSDPVTWEFARGDWDSFVQVANLWACFFWWTYDDYAEIVYGGMTDQEAQFSQVNFLNVSFRLMGINR